MLIDKGSDRILGFTVFGAEASELMAKAKTAMLGDLPYTTLRDALVHASDCGRRTHDALANVESRSVSHITRKEDARETLL